MCHKEGGKSSLYVRVGGFVDFARIKLSGFEKLWNSMKL